MYVTVRSLNPSGLDPAYTAGKIGTQALLWYRLFPNPTFGAGILWALFLAAGPLAVWLFLLIRRGVWRPNLWQALAVTGRHVGVFRAGVPGMQLRSLHIAESAGAVLVHAFCLTKRKTLL